MIVLLTDYGYSGPYLGQLKARLYQDSPDAKVIDLIHDLPAFNISAAASLLPAITKSFPENSIFICVVDPGVGSDRKAVLHEINSQYFIGPDNGLFDNLVENNNKAKRWEISWRPSHLSDSFHGRDLFAPVASLLFNELLNFDTDLKIYPFESNLSPDETNGKSNVESKPRLIYFDGFGNAISSIKRNVINKESKLKIAKEIIPYNRVFSEVSKGQCFWYYNSLDLVEVACNQKSAKKRKRIINDSLSNSKLLIYRDSFINEGNYYDQTNPSPMANTI